MMDLIIQLAAPALRVLVTAAMLLVILNDWRLTLAALAAQYMCAAVLLAQIVLWQVAAVKLLVGTLVVAILWITGQQVNFGRRASAHLLAFPTGFAFRVLAAAMVGAAAWYTAGQPSYRLPGFEAVPALNTAAFVLTALALLNLGLTEEPVNTGTGLLTLLTGFGLFYAAVEPSLAIVALLAGVEFGVALAVSYLALVQYPALEKGASD